MERTRRGVLGAGVGVAAGLAGCLGVEGVEYPVEDGASGDADAVSTADGAEDADALDQTDRADNEALADATRRVVDDAVWFASEYPDAIATYLDAIADVVADVVDVRESVREREAVTTAMADRLEESGLRAAEIAGDALEPHFRPRGGIVDRTERHVEVLRNFADRDDVDRFIEELDRMDTGFSSIGTGTYVEEAFSRDPIHNRLLDRLLYPLPDDPRRRREVRGGTLVELRVASRGFGTYAHEPYDEEAWDREEIPRIYGAAVNADRRAEIRARFGPITQPDERVEELFFVVADRPEPSEDRSEVFEGWPEELGGTPVYVQRYEDAATAGDRLDAVVAEGGVEDTEPIDPDESRTDQGEDAATLWHRYYHHDARGERYRFDEHAGVQYGYVARAGEFLLATGFSGDAWEERAGWQGVLEHGWAVV